MAQTQKHDVKSTEKKKKKSCTLESSRETEEPAAGAARWEEGLALPRPLQLAPDPSATPRAAWAPPERWDWAPACSRASAALVHMDSHGPLRRSRVGAATAPLPSSLKSSNLVICHSCGDHPPSCTLVQVQACDPGAGGSTAPLPKAQRVPAAFPGQTASKGAACQAGGRAWGDGLERSCSTACGMRHL